MKLLKKIMFTVLCIMMFVGMMTISAFAKDKKVNVTVKWEGAEGTMNAWCWGACENYTASKSWPGDAMTDNGDGTYTISFTITDAEDATVGFIPSCDLGQTVDVIIPAEGDVTVVVGELNDADKYEATVEGAPEGTPEGTPEDIVDDSIVEDKIDLSTCNISLSEEKYYYDGKAKKPVVSVEFNGEYISDKYYDVIYKNNIEVGTATVVIKAKKGNGICEGKKSLNFKIAKSQKVNITVKWEKAKGSVYAWIWDEENNEIYGNKKEWPGDKMKKKSDGTYTADFYIPKNCKAVSIVTSCGLGQTLDINNIPIISGKLLVTVFNKKETDINDLNYNKYIATAKDTAEKANSKIKLSECKIKLSKKSYEYDGKAKKPTVVVTYRNVVVSEKYYDVTYKNNKKPGRATVVVTAKKGNKKLEGKTSEKFDIVKMIDTLITVKWSKAKGDLRLSIYDDKYNVYCESMVMHENGDGTYSFICSMPQNAGNNTLEVNSSKGNVVLEKFSTSTGNVLITVSKKVDTETGCYNSTVKDLKAITGKDSIDLSKSKILVLENNIEYDGKAKKPDVVVIYNNRIVPSKYYTVSYKNNVKGGNAKVIVTANKKYSKVKGKTSTKFYIAKNKEIIITAKWTKAEDTVYAWIWDKNENYTESKCWPGDAMEDNGDGTYSIKIKVSDSVKKINFIVSCKLGQTIDVVDLSTSTGKILVNVLGKNKELSLPGNTYYDATGKTVK